MFKASEKQAKSCPLKLKKLTPKRCATHRKGALLASFFIDSEDIFNNFLPSPHRPLSAPLIVNMVRRGH
jgi:hypothetical protein